MEELKKIQSANLELIDENNMLDDYLADVNEVIEKSLPHSDDSTNVCVSENPSKKDSEIGGIENITSENVGVSKEKKEKNIDCTGIKFGNSNCKPYSDFKKNSDEGDSSDEDVTKESRIVNQTKVLHQKVSGSFSTNCEKDNIELKSSKMSRVD